MIMSFVFALVILTLGAHWFIKSSVAIALHFRIPKLFIAMLVMSFATSIPEIWVVIKAAQMGSIELAIGNIIGSYVANISFAIGLPAMLSPIMVKQHLTKRDLPIALFVLSLTFLLLADGFLSQIDALILFGFLLIWLGFMLYQIRGGMDKRATKIQKKLSIYKAIPLFILGVVLLQYGANAMVETAILISKYYDIAPVLVGLTVVAIGTSLPEVAAAISSVLHGDVELAVGTALGSNIFLLLFALPAAIIVHQSSFSSSHIWHEYLFLALITGAFWLFSAQFDRVLRINRLEGFFLVLMGLAFYFLQTRIF